MSALEGPTTAPSWAGVVTVVTVTASLLGVARFVAVGGVAPTVLWAVQGVVLCVVVGWELLVASAGEHRLHVLTLATGAYIGGANALAVDVGPAAAAMLVLPGAAVVGLYANALISARATTSVRQWRATRLLLLTAWCAPLTATTAAVVSRQLSGSWPVAAQVVALTLISLAVTALGGAVLWADTDQADAAIARTATWFGLATIAVAVAAGWIGYTSWAQARTGLAYQPVGLVLAALSVPATALLLYRPMAGLALRVFDRNRHQALHVIRAAEGTARRTLDPATALVLALRQGLHDPDLDVAFAVDHHDVAADGTPKTLMATKGRAVTEVRRDGCRLGVIAHAARLTNTPLLAAVTDAAGLLFDNAGLAAALRVQTQHSQQAIAAVEQAAQAQRRQMERDLHDGVQGRIVAVALSLAAARESSPDTALDGTVHAAIGQLHHAIGQLRELAAGRVPQLETGLGPALTSFCSALPVPVAIDVDLPPLVHEHTAGLYFVACEAITNACKHAAAQRILIHGRHQAHTLILTVTDDGTGHANPAGAGLRGIRERMQAIGGSLTILSTPGTGTTVEATLPCAS